MGVNPQLLGSAPRDTELTELEKLAQLKFNTAIPSYVSYQLFEEGFSSVAELHVKVKDGIEELAAGLCGGQPAPMLGPKAVGFVLKYSLPGRLLIP